MLRCLCTVFSCLLVVACGQGGQSAHDGATLPQEITLNLMTDPVSLDPSFAWDSASSMVVMELFEGLTRIGPNGEAQPAIAASYEVSTDDKTYVFHLRDALWSNGEPVTAHDFVHTWSKQVAPDYPSPMAEHLYVLKNGEDIKSGQKPLSELGVYAPDDKTLVVVLEYPTPFFLELVATSAFLPVHKATDLNSKDWTKRPESFVSNGPFLFKQWVHSDTVIAERNPSFWDAKNVPLERINWVIISDPNTELSLFEAGDLDWAGSPMSYLPTDAIPSLRASGKLQVQGRAAVYYYLLNTESYPLQNRSFRKALAYAVNRDSIVEHILQSGEEPATNLVPPIVLGSSPSYFPSYDPERARALLKQALLELDIESDKLPAFVLSYNSNETHQIIAEAIQEQWRETLGIDVTLQNEEWKVYLDKLQSGEFQIGRMGYNAHVGDALIFLDIFDNAHDAENFTGWEDPAYAALVDGVRRATRPEKRNELIQQAEQVLMDEMPIIPIYHYANVFLQNPRLKGVAMGKTGLPDFRWAHKK